MTTDMNLLADSYDAAADYLEQHGWFQGNLTPAFTPSEYIRGEDSIAQVNGTVRYIQTEKPSVCLMGAGYAIGVVYPLGNFVLDQDVTTRFSEFDWYSWSTPLREQMNGEDPVSFNDWVANSAEDVIDVLRVTAEKIRANHG